MSNWRRARRLWNDCSRRILRVQRGRWDARTIVIVIFIKHRRLLIKSLFWTWTEVRNTGKVTVKIEIISHQVGVELLPLIVSVYWISLRFWLRDLRRMAKFYLDLRIKHQANKLIQRDMTLLAFSNSRKVTVNLLKRAILHLLPNLCFLHLYWRAKSISNLVAACFKTPRWTWAHTRSKHSPNR